MQICGWVKVKACYVASMTAEKNENKMDPSICVSGYGNRSNPKQLTNASMRRQFL